MSLNGHVMERTHTHKVYKVLKTAGRVLGPAEESFAPETRFHQLKRLAANACTLQQFVAIVLKETDLPGRSYADAISQRSASNLFQAGARHQKLTDLRAVARASSTAGISALNYDRGNFINVFNKGRAPRGILKSSDAISHQPGMPSDVDGQGKSRIPVCCVVAANCRAQRYCLDGRRDHACNSKQTLRACADCGDIFLCRTLRHVENKQKEVLSA